MYIVEGTIGVGKSTFLKMLSQQLSEITVMLEPVDSWQDAAFSQSLLAHFYEQPTRWAYTMETFTMMKRVVDHIRENSSYSSMIMERSIYSGHYVFARNSYESGFMNDMEWNLYNQWFEFLANKCNPPKGFIYLKIDLLKAFERIQKRNRTAEVMIPLEYLHQLEKQHERFLYHKENVLPCLKNVPVLILDCNEEFEHNPQQFQRHCAKVKEFLAQ